MNKSINISDLLDLCIRNKMTPDLWSIHKNYWKDIQSNINDGRLCPVCGKLCRIRFRSHILSHGISIKDYIIFRDEITEFPKCPICSNDCGINFHNFRILNTCGSSKCMHSLSNLTRVKLGNHNFAYNGNKEHDLSKWNELHYKSIKRIERGDNILAYNGDPDHDKKVLEFHRNKLLLRDTHNLCGWHSRPEDKLSEVIIKLSIHYEREYQVMRGKYRIDYYLPDYNIGLECDGMYKWINSDGELILKDSYKLRSRDIELNTGIIILNIPSNKVYYYSKFPRELWNEINKLKYNLIRT